MILIEQGNANFQLTDAHGSSILHLAFMGSTNPAGSHAVLSAALQQLLSNDVSPQAITDLITTPDNAGVQ